MKYNKGRVKLLPFKKSFFFFFFFFFLSDSFHFVPVWAFFLLSLNGFKLKQNKQKKNLKNCIAKYKVYILYQCTQSTLLFCPPSLPLGFLSSDLHTTWTFDKPSNCCHHPVLSWCLYKALLSILISFV